MINSLPLKSINREGRIRLFEHPISYLYKLYSIYILAINYVKIHLHLLNTHYFISFTIGQEWERNRSGMGAAHNMITRC